jgi:hypothetical protein
MLRRTVADIRALSGGDAATDAFAAVAEVSACASRAYDACIAPVLRPLATEPVAELGRRLHPLRLRRTAVSSHNPALAHLPALAAQSRRDRRPAGPDNVFRQVEQIWAEQVEQALDTWRDLRDATTEILFFASYGWLASFGIGQGFTAGHRAAEHRGGDPASSPTIAEQCHEGGYAEAVIRMMLLLAKARGGVRRSRLARSKLLLNSQPPFSAMPQARRQAVIQAQGTLVAQVPELCIDTLPLLLPDTDMRRQAMAAVEQVAGPVDDLGMAARAMLGRLRATLGRDAGQELVAIAAE